MKNTTWHCLNYYFGVTKFPECAYKSFVTAWEIAEIYKYGWTMRNGYSRLF